MLLPDNNPRTQTMPQDSLRSVGYRSFVTCDDPKGVVECRTIRKSKTRSQKMEGKLENQKMPKNFNRSISYKEEKKEIVSKWGTEESNGASSFQLMEVSRGAQRLNQVIDSWSKGMSFNGQSKDIAKDLLRGALDLQESLVMLGKLQEASQCMTKLKKKQKEKTGLGKADEVGIERTNTNRFGNPNYQNPRLSADGSSRDCYEELREVIRDSLARQNLLPNKSSEEKAYFDRRKRNLYADIPSTSSSSISSMAYSHDFASSESSISSKIIGEKPKVSNLIAKLMGLEEIPSKPLQSASRKQLERDKILNQRKQIFDIDIRKERKPQFVAQKVDRECMTLEEIIDNMQFKGLLKSNLYQTYHSNTSYLEKRLSNDAPPIVLMKPMHPRVEAEDLFTHKFTPEEEALDPEENPRIWKTKEVIPSKMEQYPGGALNSNEMRRNLHCEESTVKKIPREKGTKASKKVLPKQEDKEIKIKEKLSSNKMKASVPVSSRPQKEVTEKKVDKVQKITSRKKPIEMERVKSTSVPGSHEQDKVPMTILRKSETGSKVVNKNRITQQKSTTSHSITKRTKPAISHSENDQKKSVKNIKPVKEPLSTNVENVACKDDDNHIDDKNKSDTTVKETTPALQLLADEETADASKTLIKESCDHIINPLCEDTLMPTPHENDTKCPEKATHCSNHVLTESNLFETRNVADILSGIPSFLSHVEEPFDNFDAFQPIVLQAFTALHDCGIYDSKLLSDCANELLESSSQRHVPSVHPLLQKPVDDSRFCISIDHLMEEACSGIKNLSSYSDLARERFPADTVFAVLERDLWCKGLVAGVWDMGWRVGYTADEVQQIVTDMDKLVLDDLIQEVLSDFV